MSFLTGALPGTSWFDKLTMRSSGEAQSISRPQRDSRKAQSLSSPHGEPVDHEGVAPTGEQAHD